MVQQLLSAKDLKAQTDAPMISTNTGAKPGYVSGGLPVNKGLPKASVAVPNAQPIGAISGVNAPSPVQQAVSTAQKSPAMQKDFTNAFSPKAAPTNQIPENIPVVKDNVDVDKGLSDLTSQLTEGVRAGKTINIDKLKSAYPEFSHVNNEVLQELTNQLSEGIKAGKTLNMDKLKQAYPELSGGQDSSIQGGLKGEVARMSPIDLGHKGEWINPIGRVAEIIDEQAQKIGTVDVTRGPEMALNQRIANLSPKEIAKYRENFNNLKRDHPVMARLFKVPKGSNLVGQLWNAIKGEYEDVGDEKEFQGYIYEQEKDYIDQLVGAGTDGPNVVNMAANIPGSAVKTASAVTRAITNPADTLAGLGKLIFTEEGHQAIIDRYGSREAFAKSMETDPIGVASDALALIQGGASLTKGGATVTSKLAASAGATDFAAASSKFAAKAGGVANTAGAASNLGMDLLVPKGVNFLKDATKVADNASPMAKLPNTIANYGAAVISPLDSLVHVAKGAKDLLPTAEGVLQRMNRLTKSNQEKFQKVVGVSEGEWLNNNIGPKTPVQTVEALGERIKSNINEVDTALEQIEGGQKYTPVEYETKDGDIVKYEGDAVKDMAEDAVGYAERTGDPRAKVMQGILDKYNEGTATMTDINKLQRYYQANVRLGYFKDMTAGEKTARSTNIDSAVREWKFKVGEENGFDNFREINKDTQASMIILKALEKNEAGKLGNNAVTLTDWIVAAAALTNPEVLPAVIGKMVLQSNWFSRIYAQVLNKLNGHTIQAQKAADMAKISQMKTEKEFKEWLAEENKTAKQLRSKAEQEEFNAKTKALPSPENATKSNLGTDKNPIVSKGLQPKQVLEINNPDAPSSIRNSSSYVSGLPPKGQVEKGLKPKSESKGLTPKVVDNLTETPKKDILSSDVSATKEMNKYNDIVMTEAYSAPTYELYAKGTKAEFPEMTDIEIKDAYAIAQKWKSNPVSKALVDYKLAVTGGSAGELGNALLKTLETDKQLAPKIAEASKDIVKEQNIKEIYRYGDKEGYSRTTKPDEYFANGRPLQTMKVTPDVLDRIVYAEGAETKLGYEAFPNTGEGEIILKPKPTNKGLQPKVVDNLTETPKSKPSSDGSANKGLKPNKGLPVKDELGGFSEPATMEQMEKLDNLNFNADEYVKDKFKQLELNKRDSGFSEGMSNAYHVQDQIAENIFGGYKYMDKSIDYAKLVEDAHPKVQRKLYDEFFNGLEEGFRPEQSYAFDRSTVTDNLPQYKAAKSELDSFLDTLDGEPVKVPLKILDKEGNIREGVEDGVFKGVDRVLEKSLKAGKLKDKDVVRATQLFEQSKDMNDVVAKMRNMKNISDIEVKIPGKDPLGYGDVSVVFTAKNGVKSELQLNTYAMQYGKDGNVPKEIAKKIKEATGLEPGLGHKYYEEWQSIKKKSLESGAKKSQAIIDIEEKSNSYYGALRKYMISTQ